MPVVSKTSNIRWQSIYQHANEEGVEIREITDFKAIPGHGVSGNVASTTYYLVNRALITTLSLDISKAERKLQKLEDAGKTAMLLATAEKILGIVAAADTLKETTKEAVEQLQKLGLEVHMLTGDNQRTANAIARQVGITNVMAEVLPQDKAKQVEKLKVRAYVWLWSAMASTTAQRWPSNVGIAMGSELASPWGRRRVIIKNDARCGSRDQTEQNHGKKFDRIFSLFYNVMGIPIAAQAFAV